jgi:hypothetical protein
LYVPPPEWEDTAMRKLTLAVAALLACAASPALAQSGPGTPAVEPPSAAQVAPSPPNPPKPESVPAAPKAPIVTDNVPPGRPGRFSFNRVDDGFLRLDNQSGEIAYCSPHAVGWACQAVPEDRAALEKEIARLQDEVASLKAQVAALREPPPLPRPPADLTPPPPRERPPPPMADKDQDTAKLREDLERARLAFENAWRRLVDMIINLQKDMMRKG